MFKTIKIIITKTAEKELKAVSKYFSEEHIKKTAIKAYGGLGIDLSDKSKNSEMKKIYLTSKGNVGRVLFLVHRLKN